MNPLMSQGLAIAIATIISVMSWRYGYQAAQHRYQHDHRQLDELTTQVGQWEQKVQAAGGQTAWLTTQQQRLVQLKARFPQQQQLPQLLNTLVERWKASDLKLVNVAQGNVEAVRDADAPILIGGAPCYRLPVTVTTEGRYLALVGMIEQLTSDTFPVMVSIDQIELRRKGVATPLLEATLGISLYVLGAPSNG